MYVPLPEYRNTSRAKGSPVLRASSMKAMTKQSICLIGGQRTKEENEKIMPYVLRYNGCKLNKYGLFVRSVALREQFLLYCQFTLLFCAILHSEPVQAHVRQMYCTTVYYEVTQKHEHKYSKYNTPYAVRFAHGHHFTNTTTTLLYVNGFLQQFKYFEHCAVWSRIILR